MFGISPFGWLHALGSLPAIPAAAYMFIRYGRIAPKTTSGVIYLVAMIIGSLSVFLVAKTPVSNVAAVITLIVLGVGYTADRYTFLGRRQKYLKTFCLTFSVLLLMVPTVSEILRRVPDGHPIASGTDDPIIKAALGVLALIFILGVSTQFIFLHRKAAKAG
ncbi:hypothetical protein [Thalassospira sp. CH_XMU1448-2]|uniref:hypothetical protein n=1 Tax=Thalassospira sp. CH_XMU1448-2 TaxID=3107773 RepID=UPI003008A7FE